MNIRNIRIVADYEARILSRSWMFRIFSGLSVFVITLIILFQHTHIFSFWHLAWPHSALSSFFPFNATMMYTVSLCLILPVLSGNFLKRDKKTDTAEVIFVHAMSNADYISGKCLGSLKLFLKVEFLFLGCIALINILAADGPFNFFFYLYYPLTVSLPAFVFVIGISYFLASVFGNPSLSMIAVIAFVIIDLSYLNEVSYGIADITCIQTAAVFSDATKTMAHPLPFVWKQSLILFSGIGFIFLTTAMFKRIPNSHIRKRLNTACGLSFLLIAGICAFLYLRQFQSTAEKRKAYIATYKKFDGHPTVDIRENEMEINIGPEEIKTVSALKISNPSDKNISAILLFLNPGLKIEEIRINGEETLYKRENQAVVIEYGLAAWDSCDIRISYSGKIEEAVLYTDIDSSEFFRPKKLKEPLILGERYAYTGDFTLLCPETLWYPRAQAPENPISVYETVREFTLFKLKVKTHKAQTVISQGKKREEEGYTVFENENPLEGVNLIAGPYTERRLKTGNTEYAFFSLKGKNPLIEGLEKNRDTLPALIKEIRKETEGNIGISYPFKRFSIVEVPVHFYGYYRPWKNHTSFAAPELALLPEKGATIPHFDMPGTIRMEKMEQMQEVSNQEMEYKILKRILNRILFEKNENIFFKISSSKETSFNIYDQNSQIFGMNHFIASDSFPFMNIVISEALSQKQDEARPPWWRRGLDRKEKALLYLKDKSLREAVKDKNIDNEVLQAIIRLKSTSLLHYIYSRIEKEDFKRFIRNFFETRNFKTTGFEEFAKEVEIECGVDLRKYVRKWTYENSPAVFDIKEPVVQKTTVDEYTKYRLSLKVYNSSNEGDGILSLKLVSAIPGGRSGRHRRRSRNRTEDARYYYYHIPAGDAVEIVLLEDEIPRELEIDRNICRNIPNKKTFKFEHIEAETADTTSGVFKISAEEFETAYGDIIIDNESPHCSILSSNDKQTYIRKLLKNKNREKYGYLNIWNPPSLWTLCIGPECYGEIASAYYKKSGNGKNSVKWSTEIPEDGRYAVYVWNPKMPNFYYGRRQRKNSKEEQYYRIENEGNTESFSLDLRQAENGWIYMDTYYLHKGKAVVSLSDLSHSKYIIADAVRLKLLK